MDKANKKLIDCILLLMDRVREAENQVKINWENVSIEDFNMKEFESMLSSRDNVADQIYKIRSHWELGWSILLREWVSINLSDDKLPNLVNISSVSWRHQNKACSKRKIKSKTWY